MVNRVNRSLRNGGTEIKKQETITTSKKAPKQTTQLRKHAYVLIYCNF